MGTKTDLPIAGTLLLCPAMAGPASATYADRDGGRPGMRFPRPALQPGTEVGMDRGRRRIVALAGLVAVMLMAVMAPGAAAAQPVEQAHDTFSDTNTTDNLCGIDGSSYDNGVDNFAVFADGSSRDEFRLNYVFTSSATGRSVELFVAQVSAATVDVHPDGSRTYIVTFNGLPEKIRLPNGSVLSRDAGRVIFLDTEDADGNFVSRTLIDESGPHPDLDSDFAIFCDVIVPALS
jgi:hypothetical protein